MTGSGVRRPRARRAVLLIVLVVVAVALLFTVVFPWIDETFVNDPVLGAALVAHLDRAGGLTSRGSNTSP